MKPVSHENRPSSLQSGGVGAGEYLIVLKVYSLPFEFNRLVPN